MTAKKGLRADGTYIISKDKTDNPKLGAKVLSNGTESLFLDYYLGYDMVYSEKVDKMIARKKRKREYLQMYLCKAPKTPIERESNKNTLILAKTIRTSKAKELIEDITGFTFVKDNKNINFLSYFQDYIDNYTKKDKRVINESFNRFKDFLNDIPKYNKFANSISPTQIDKYMMIDFADYIKSRSVGEGARSIWKRFKKVINYAIEHDIIKDNPCKGIQVKASDDTLRKDILNDEEIEQLIRTHYARENPNIRNAFIFSLYTGLRWCDVKNITFGAINYKDKTFTIEQEKVKGHSKNSMVENPLLDEIIEMIGKPKTSNPETELIFNLPSSTMCLKALRVWTKKAGIEKHITWHLARHREFYKHQIINRLYCL